MKDSILLTILVGVSVFVLSQFILKLVLDPLVEFKKALGEISYFFLKEQADITHANCPIETPNEIKRLSATLMSLKEAIPFYRSVSKILSLPSEENVVKACGSLNQISYSVNRGSHLATAPLPLAEPDHMSIHNIIREMHKIEENLNIRVRY